MQIHRTVIQDISLHLPPLRC